MNKPLPIAVGGVLMGFAAIAFGAAVSGLGVGERVTPFHPTHVGGPDKGTDTCPP